MHESSQNIYMHKPSQNAYMHAPLLNKSVADKFAGSRRILRRLHQEDKMGSLFLTPGSLHYLAYID